MTKPVACGINDDLAVIRVKESKLCKGDGADYRTPPLSYLRAKLLLAFSGALLFILFFQAGLVNVSAHANLERSNPPNNAHLPAGKPPTEVQVWFAEVIEPRYSNLTVVDKSGKRIDRGDSRVPSDDNKSLLVSLKPDIPDGVYTVIYNNASAEDGHTLKGSYSFIVGAASSTAAQDEISPLDLAEQGQNPDNENANFFSITLKWLNYLSGAALLGALGFSLLVWQKVVKRLRFSKSNSPDPEMVAASGYRCTLTLAKIGLAGLFVGWLGWLIYQTGVLTHQTPWQLLGLNSPGSGPQSIFDFLLGTRYGLILLARLCLLITTAGVIWYSSRVASGNPNLLQSWKTGQVQAVKLDSGEIPGNTRSSTLLSNKRSVDKPRISEEAAVAVLNREGPPGKKTSPSFASNDKFLKLWWVAVILCAGVLLTTSLNSHSASTTGLTWRSIGFDWLHLISTGLWIGGLLSMVWHLAKIIPTLKPGSGDRTRLLAAIIPAFSQLAIFCVIVVVITGTFNSLQQLNTPGELITTSYGISLSVKIGLMFPLMLLAAYNLLLISPQMRLFAGAKKSTREEGPGSLAAGALGNRFKRTVLAEAILGVLLLLTTSFLTTNPPPKTTPVVAKPYYVQLEQADIKLDLAISPFSLGDNSFELRITDKKTGQVIPDARLVDFQPKMQGGMDMGETTFKLLPVEGRPGRYSGQNSVLSMTGDWIFNIRVQRDGHDDVNVPVELNLK